mmetsp:Transcript_15599/g.25686  ORF Transcript_15599/g.25686 Transcript_15599/m.25686 type:complete len:203 (+) Transcript_15599:2179-2787(+)
MWPHLKMAKVSPTMAFVRNWPRPSHQMEFGKRDALHHRLHGVQQISRSRSRRFKTALQGNPLPSLCLLFLIMASHLVLVAMEPNALYANCRRLLLLLLLLLLQTLPAPNHIELETRGALHRQLRRGQMNVSRNRSRSRSRSMSMSDHVGEGVEKSPKGCEGPPCASQLDMRCRACLTMFSAIRTCTSLWWNKSMHLRAIWNS